MQIPANRCRKKDVKPITVYLEARTKRIFAGALDWPGWSRGGTDEHTALQALVDYGPRYAAAVASARLGFKAPKDAAEFRVVEHLLGNSSTDFGVPAVPPSYDKRPLSDKELARLKALLQGCWSAFDASASAAGSSTLKKGPRGGGRDIARMRAHVLEGDGSYLVQLGGRYQVQGKNTAVAMTGVRETFLDALAARVRGELPGEGPRGGVRWPPRYAVRRSAWHALDHAWEIEDRVQ